MRYARDVIIWIGIFLVPVVGWAFRDEVGYVASRVYAVLVPGAAVSTGERVVTVARAGRGGFEVRGRVNDAAANFVFDTGASMVVLTPRTAESAGVSLARLNYSVTVATANGRTVAAPVMIETLTIGDIRIRDVQALVARQGDLFENLLGMSFLSRLESYEVQGQRLVLRGRSGS